MKVASRSRQWESAAAVKRLRIWAGAERTPNAKYASVFVWHDRKAADQFGAYKLPFADVVDGEVMIVPAAVFAIAAALQGARGGVDIPEADMPSVKKKVEDLYDQIAEAEDRDDLEVPWSKETAKAKVEDGFWSSIFIGTRVGNNQGLGGGKGMPGGRRSNANTGGCTNGGSGKGKGGGAGKGTGRKG